METKELEILIPSETVRKYISETGYAFTDWQKAALLYRQDQPFNAAREALCLLRDTTNDIALEYQLAQYLSREEKALEMLKENSDRDFIFIVTYKDEDSEETGYFFEYEMALQYGMETKVAFSIEKHLVCAENVIDQYEDGKYRDYASATICYDENGNIEYFDSEELPPAEWDSGVEWHDWFGNMFFEVPNPFERGDIVKVVGSEDYGIVETSQADWQEDLERSKASDEKYRMDHSDVQLRVVFPDDNAHFYHEHINPVFLERCDMSWYHGMPPFEELIYFTSDVYKNKGTPSTIEYYRREYLWSKKQEEKKG